MHSVWIWLAITLLLVLLTARTFFTVSRLDRLHARLDAAYAALDGQLVRRAAALWQVIESSAGHNESGHSEAGHTEVGEYDRRDDLATCVASISSRADNADDPTDHAAREAVENQVGRVIATIAQHPHRVADADTRASIELYEACLRVVIARRFYNDAVRDTRTLREHRTVRLLRMAGHRQMPLYFEVDDSQSFPMPAEAAHASPVPEPPIQESA